MQTLKKILSVVAFVLGVVGAGGDVLHIAPALCGLFLAGASLLAMEGVTPASITPVMSRAFGIVSSAAVLMVGAHATGELMGPATAHVALFKVIGFVGMLFGLAGKNPVTSAPHPERVAAAVGTVACLVMLQHPLTHLVLVGALGG